MRQKNKRPEGPLGQARKRGAVALAAVLIGVPGLFGCSKITGVDYSNGFNGVGFESFDAGYVGASIVVEAGGAGQQEVVAKLQVDKSSSGFSDTDIPCAVITSATAALTIDGKVVAQHDLFDKSSCADHEVRLTSSGVAPGQHNVAVAFTATDDLKKAAQPSKAYAYAIENWAGDCTGIGNNQVSCGWATDSYPVTIAQPSAGSSPAGSAPSAPSTTSQAPSSAHASTTSQAPSSAPSSSSPASAAPDKLPGLPDPNQPLVDPHTGKVMREHLLTNQVLLAQEAGGNPAGCSKDKVDEQPHLQFVADCVALATQDAKAVGIPVIYYLAQIAQESSFDGHSNSWASAVGIAQFTPDTASQFRNPFNQSKPFDPWDPAQSLMVAAGMMKDSWDHYKHLGAGPTEAYLLATAEYNGGTGGTGKLARPLVLDSHGRPTCNWNTTLWAESEDYLYKIEGVPYIPGSVYEYVDKAHGIDIWVGHIDLSGIRTTTAGCHN